MSKLSCGLKAQNFNFLCLKPCQNFTNLPPSSFSQILVADVSDESSLDRMASRAKVVLNCVGPYRFYGEQVVRACLRQGAHHLDISGEPQFLETMQLKYNEEADQKGQQIL